MNRISMFLTVTAIHFAVLLNVSTVSARAQGNPKTGGQMFRVCASCHSLQPGVHLSGPSLANLWGKKSASVAGFDRYTNALKKLGETWNANSLNAWLANPRAMAPGTTMTFRGIDDNAARANLIAFLKIAIAKNGLAKAVQDGLISRRMAMGQIPPNLSAVEPSRMITKIGHCGDAFIVLTADGIERPFWESNVRIKIDTSVRGPKKTTLFCCVQAWSVTACPLSFPASSSSKLRLTKTADKTQL